MKIIPTQLYRFQIEGPVSRGVLSAIDEADRSSVQLLQVALEGTDSGKRLAALEQLATDRACESFTDGSQFYVVARTSEESAELMRAIESSGLEAFTEPEVEHNEVIPSACDTDRPPSVPSIVAGGQIHSLPNSRPNLLAWVMSVALFLVVSVTAISLLSKRQTRQAQVTPPPAPIPQERVSQPEQVKPGTPPVNDVHPLLQSPSPPDDQVSNQTTPQHQPQANGELLQQRTPVAPVVPTMQLGPQEQSPTAKLDQGPSVPVVQNMHVDLPTPPQPPKVRFAADSTQLKLGQTTSLRWEVTGASDVRLEPNLGPVDQSGSLMVRPMGKTAYTIHAIGQGGETNAMVDISISGLAGPATGQLIWTGNVSGIQLVTIDHDHADVGSVEGALPRLPCVIQPTNEKKVGIVVTPSPTNNYDRLVLRVVGKGSMRIVIDWAVQY
ncbi:MAG: hypothetical protein WCA10_15550 [Terracidiphilus sp.]